MSKDTNTTDAKTTDDGNKASHFDKVVSVFSSSQVEEIFMYLSIITALMCDYTGHNILAWVFMIKAITELIASIVLAIKERLKK